MRKIDQSLHSHVYEGSENSENGEGRLEWSCRLCHRVRKIDQGLHSHVYEGSEHSEKTSRVVRIMRTEKRG